MYARPCFVVVDVFGLLAASQSPHCHKSVTSPKLKVQQLRARQNALFRSLGVKDLGSKEMTDDSIAFDLLATVETPVRSFRAGDVIFNEGDRAEESYVIQKGQVEIRRNGRLLDTLTEKSIFGEMALIDHAPRAATAVAATDVVLVPVAEKQFLFLVSQTPYFALNVMRVLARRLRSANGAT
jgi:CRP/FNR family transcriptional regulator, cyclic AMP receptor protein